MTKEAYYDSERIRLLKRYNTKHSSFGTKEAFADWYVSQLKKQACKCFYCDTSIHDINKLIDAKKLRTRQVRGDGVRGRVLEIDKMENEKGYLTNNCVLACYYCNNDKSYTLDSMEYKEYFGANRSRYHQILLNQI